MRLTYHVTQPIQLVNQDMSLAVGGQLIANDNGILAQYRSESLVDSARVSRIAIAALVGSGMIAQTR